MISFMIKTIDKNKSLIESVYIIASVLTILSILFAVGTYYDQRKIEQENEEIILENLGYEIEGNLVLINWFEQHRQEYLLGNKFIATRYQYYFLEKSLDIIEDKNMRKSIATIISDMKQANMIMDNIDNFFLFEKDIEIINANILGVLGKNKLIDGKLQESCLIETYASYLNLSSSYCFKK